MLILSKQFYPNNFAIMHIGWRILGVEVQNILKLLRLNNSPLVQNADYIPMVNFIFKSNYCYVDVISFPIFTFLVFVGFWLEKNINAIWF